MNEPVAFTSNTHRHALPFLLAGQAQKEFFVNEAFARIDSLLHPAIGGEIADPPASPAAGDAWLVAHSATAEWAGHDGSLASWDGSQWTFLAPVDGMRVYDRSAEQTLTFRTVWQRANRPASPSGGTTIDTQARTAIEAILGILATLALIPEN